MYIFREMCPEKCTPCDREGAVPMHVLFLLFFFLLLSLEFALEPGTEK